ncbi:MAG: RNA polymerase subunit sigma-70 [Chloroflexi bacterium]|nr:RNA polymerase subunit sigma-70 [Chloroflexota bacterium]MBV9603429.1 RNA polymerase subunit sigma-70 [Chloroflexota bacterium]
MPPAAASSTEAQSSLGRGTEIVASVPADPRQDQLAAALAGDQDAFGALTDRYRRELHVHCYRLLGSFQDAEDAVQETLMRAWRHLASFEGRSSFRAWLYRLATNVALTQRNRPRIVTQPFPQVLADAASSSSEPAIRLSPYPDALLDELTATSGDPAAEIELRESVQLAFLAAVQLLPPRQRAALILRDVVGFPADAVAEMLESTTDSVNSALKRARATLEQQRTAGRLTERRAAPTDEIAASLVRRYSEAWQVMDVAGLVGLLAQDVVLSMPPLPLRYVGREAAFQFFAMLPKGPVDRFRLVTTRANRQSALAVYRHDAQDGTYHAWGIWVLTVDRDVIAEVTAFVDPTLLPRFGLPETT